MKRGLFILLIVILISGCYSQQTSNIEVKPNEIISLKTDKGVYELKTVPNPENSSLAFIGVSGFEHRIEPKRDCH